MQDWCEGASKHCDICLTKQRSHHANTEPAELPHAAGKDNCNGDKACQGLAQGGGGNGNNNAGHGGGGGGFSNNGGSANINGNDNCNGAACLPACPTIAWRSTSYMHL